MSVALLESDHVAPDLRGIAGDYGEMFVRRFAASDPDIVFDRIDVVGGQPLPTVGDHDAVLVTGSQHGVADGLPWAEALADLLRGAHHAQTPVVGVCFGHQLIAHALGGRVTRAAGGWNLGVQPAEVVSQRAWMRPSLPRFSLLMTHQDQVVGLPPGAELLARTPTAPIAAFQVGSLVGIQGHPEFTPAYLDALLASRIERIGATEVSAARATLTTPTDHVELTTWLATHLRGEDGH